MNSKMILMFAGCLLLANGCTFVPKKTAEEKSYEPAEPVVVNVPRKDNGAIYQPGMRVSLFENPTASRVGDILTILLQEETSASASSSTNSAKDQQVDMPGPELAGDQVTQNGKPILQNNLGANRQFNGQGDSAMNSSFEGKLSVTVHKVLANGNLVVRGQKVLLLNQSDEYIRFMGIVRPQDVNPDNTISSHRVADVRVAYSGEGFIASANSMGPLARFFQGPTWPY
ncbi:MAG: flagellar basal body L-ring protein FlgH [Pseudomonadota bacterium]|nr:flagellar basal body L-ring protein FlgH [Pseudomonadota bacterium]